MISKIQLIVTLVAASIIIFSGKVYTGDTERFVLTKVEDITPSHDWMTMDIWTHDEEYVSLKTTVFKRFPEDAVITTRITYEHSELPEHTMVLCDSFKEKMFGDDVKQRGFPQPGFPQECPFGPHDFIEIRDWKFPHYKIPSGTTPGPVTVNITFSSGDDIMLNIYAEGEITQTLYSTVAPIPENSVSPPKLG